MNNNNTITILPVSTTSSSNSTIHSYYTTTTPAAGVLFSRRSEEELGGQQQWKEEIQCTTTNISSLKTNNFQQDTTQVVIPNNYSRESTTKLVLKNNSSRSSSNTAAQQQQHEESIQGSPEYSETMNSENFSAGILSERTNNESKPTTGITMMVSSSCPIETFKNPYHTPLLGMQSMIEPCVPIRKLPTNLTITVNNSCNSSGGAGAGLPPPFNPATIASCSASQYNFATTTKPINEISPPPPSNFPTIPTPPILLPSTTTNFTTTTTTTLSCGTCSPVFGVNHTSNHFGPTIGSFSFSKPTSSFAELGEIISQGNFGMQHNSSSQYSSSTTNTTSTTASTAATTTGGIYCNNDAISCASSTASGSTAIMEEPKKVKNRKEKSLTMICTKFIQYYEEKTNSPTTTGNQSKGDIKIEEAVTTLGIEKRRIYDILNVLESISVVTKVGVSCYKFNGTKCLHSTLEQMKTNSYLDPILFEGIQSLPKIPQNEPILKSLSKFKHSSMTQNSRSNTLTSLSRLLIMCFLATEVKEITQDQLLAIVLKDSTEKTRTRRLNDIVNILSAIHLLEKKTEKSVNIFKWLGGSFITSETKPVNSILSPSKMPLKKRKRVKAGSQGSDSETSPITVESGPSFSIVDNNSPQTEHFTTGSIGSEVSPNSIPSVSPSFFQSNTTASGNSTTGTNTTCKTPTSSGSNSSGGLHFQFRSPPSKKNKIAPTSLSSFTTVLGCGPKISPKNLNEIFKTSEQQPAKVAVNVPIHSPTITPNSAIITTFGKLGSGNIFSQATTTSQSGQVSPRVMPSTIRATIFNENNKENACIIKPVPVLQTAKKLSTVGPCNNSPTTQQQPAGKITFKIRGANETTAPTRQPLGLKTDNNGVNNQYNIKAPRP